MLTTRSVLGAAILLASATALAQSPNTSAAFRPGANHHIGDDAFIAKYHRQPTDADEKLRMREHFLAAKAILEKRPATRPELEARRKQILAAFDEYIAKGTTPKNGHLPWRTPVFIDDENTICAVGYLIERTVGRGVAEKVAASHRYSYLEEIAAAMPEVAAWVATSGFTLDELSTIQPGYEGPTVSWTAAWSPKKDKVPDGAFPASRPAKDPDGPTYDELRLVSPNAKGQITHGKMEGTWTVDDGAGHIIGKGELVHGTGAWLSSYPDGKPLAVGRLVNNEASGDWKIYHPDGVLAAEGRLAHGARDGKWSFYYDNPTKTPIAIGSFKKGWTVGTWKHFDDRGKLLATSSDSNDAWGQYGQMYMLDIVPGPDKVHHRVHEGDVGGDHRRLDELATQNGEEKLFVQYHNEQVFDASGDELKRTDKGWISADCGWTPAMKKAARTNNLARLHALVQHLEDEHACAEPKQVPAARGARIDAMLASFKAVRAQSPDFIRKLALGEATPADADPDAGDEHVQEANNEAKATAEDLAKTLAASMMWYVEFPHVDGLFTKLFGTIAGERITGGN